MTTIPFANLPDGDDPLGQFEPDEAVTAAIHRPGLDLAQVMEAVFTGYADRPALSRYRRDASPTDATPQMTDAFETLTYRDTWTAVREVAAAWHADGVRPGDIIGILGFSSPEFVIADLAAIHLGAVTVPLPGNLPPDRLGAILSEIEARWIASSLADLPLAVAAILAGTAPPSLMVLDNNPARETDALAIDRASSEMAASGVKISTLDAVRADGRSKPLPPLFVPSAGEDPLSTVYYTSGSTGSPKGAMYSRRLVKAAWMPLPPGPQIALQYLPLSHSWGRSSVFLTLARGGHSYFAAKSDLSTLLDDLATVRPTNIAMVPRVSEILYQRFTAELDRRVLAGADPATTRANVIEDMRTRLLGGRIRSAVTGSAPISDELRAFMGELLGFPLGDGYGTTETGMVMINGAVVRPPVIDYKLADVPEFGYFSTDKPHPRGELLVKSERAIPGYFRRPELSAGMFDEAGYYKTGDIMAEVAPDRLVYLDRRNNVLKLAQGEFIAIATIEAILTSGSPAIQQVYLYGNSSRSFLLAVVVPDRTVLPIDLGTTATKQALSDAIRAVASAQSLNAYEVPRDFIVEEEPFSTENGLLAGIGKYLRPAFSARYAARLEAMYEDIAASQDADLRAFRRSAREMPVLEAVCCAAQAILGNPSIDSAGVDSFGALGGDSLSALSFALLLEETLDVSIDVGAILHPSATLASLASGLARQLAGEEHRRVQVADIHGPDARILKASDLRIDRFIDAETLAIARTLPPASTDEPRTILLTGANGFLGRAICLEWLDRAGRTGAKLVCIIRAPDDVAAHVRLREVFESGDAVLLDKFDSLAAKHLVVHAGDISAVHLGLSDADWMSLVATVDLIVHPAALVNHKLPYTQLFGPNIVGTAELVRLALTQRIKRIAFVSTIAAASKADGTYIGEGEPVAAALPEWVPSERYADGYASSKWAGEVLLADACDTFGLPCSVLRSDMILAHSRYRGQINVPDMFTRWLISIVATGIAPVSFYRQDIGQAIRAHYDGIPADFTAKAVVALAEAQRSGHQCFHLVNGHDDGASLDSFVDWIESSGHPVQRIEDYGTWFERFETKLRALPDSKRTATLLPLIDSFRQPSVAVAGSPIPHDLFASRIEELGIGHVPHLTEAFIHKCIGDIEALGLID